MKLPAIELCLCHMIYLHYGRRWWLPRAFSRAHLIDILRRLDFMLSHVFHIDVIAMMQCSECSVSFTGLLLPFRDFCVGNSLFAKPNVNVD